MRWLIFLALLALAAILSACSGSGDDNATSPAPTEIGSGVQMIRSLSPSPQPGEPSTSITGVPVVPFQIGEEAEIPEDVALIIEVGCTACDGPTSGLVRLYRNPAGPVRADMLFSLSVFELPPRRIVDNPKDSPTPGQPIVEQPIINGFALTEDASQIVISACTRGDCAWLGPGGLDAQVTLFCSLDGGVTWQKLAVLEGGYRVVAIANGESVLARHYIDQYPQSTTYELYPSGTSLEMQSEGQFDYRLPFFLPDGRLLWYAVTIVRANVPTTWFDYVFDTNSTLLFPFLAGREARNIDLSFQEVSGLFALSWFEGSQTKSLRYLSVAREDGSLLKVFSLPDDRYLNLGPWLSDSLLTGDSSFAAGELKSVSLGDYFGQLPILIDVDRGLIHPIAQPFLDEGPRGRNHADAVQHGTFALVVNTGDCLNIRAEPSANSQIQNCLVDGVLLRDLGETREADGQTWLKVKTPSGVDGWASTAYLEQ